MAETPAAAHGPKQSFDIGTPVGVLVGFALLIFAFVLEEGKPATLISISSMVIVFGGTSMALTGAFPLPVVLRFPAFLRKCFFTDHEDAIVTIQTFKRLADKARREGLLSLEDEAQHLENEFLKDGIQEVVDGTPPETIRELMENKISEMQERHKVGKEFMANGGGFAPTMGIIGTVMSLVVTLGGLAEFGTEVLGEKISVAFIATLYGVMTANLFWNPMSNRLKLKSEEEVLHMNLMITGILAIQAGDAPRLVQTKLESFLTPAERTRLRSAGEGAGAGAPAAAGA